MANAVTSSGDATNAWVAGLASLRAAKFLHSGKESGRMCRQYSCTWTLIKPGGVPSVLLHLDIDQVWRLLLKAAFIATWQALPPGELARDVAPEIVASSLPAVHPLLFHPPHTVHPSKHAPTPYPSAHAQHCTCSHTPHTAPYLLKEVMMELASPLATSVRFHWPMQGPHELDSTVPPILLKTSMMPSRSMVARICSEPGEMVKGTCTGQGAGGWLCMMCDGADLLETGGDGERHLQGKGEHEAVTGAVPLLCSKVEGTANTSDYQHTAQSPPH